MKIQSKKVIALTLCLIMIISIVSAVTVGAEVNEAYYSAVYSKITNTGKTAGASASEGTVNTTGNGAVSFTYKDDNGNMYWSADREVAGTGVTSVYYPTNKNTDVAYTFSESGEYVVSAKMKFGQTAEGESTHGIVFTGKNGNDTLQFQICYGTSNNTFGVDDTQVEKVYLRIGDDMIEGGKTALENGVWYTVQLFYNLDYENGTGLMNMTIDDADGTNKVTTEPVSITISSSAPVTFWNIRDYMQKQAGNSLGIDDFFIAKRVKAPVTVNYKAEEGTVYYNGTKAVSGAETLVAYNENATFTIAPEEGYKLASVTAGDAGQQPQALVVSGNTVTLSSVTTAKVLNVTFESVDYDYKVSKYTHTGKTVGATASEGTTTGTNNGTVSLSYKDDNGNIYWSADRTSDETTQTSVYYPVNSNTAVTYTFAESGEYVISAKMKFGQTHSDNAHGIVFTGKNGTKTLQFVICYNNSTNTFAAGDATREMVGLNDNGTTTEYGRIALEKDVWYTISLFYNLDYENGTGKLSMTIDDADGINQLTTTPASVSISKDAPVDFRNIRDYMQKQAGNSLGIDDFFIAKIKASAAPALEGAPSYSYDADGNSQVAYFTVNPGSGYTFTDGIAKFATEDYSLTLPIAAEMLSKANSGSWDGRFAIRVKNAVGADNPVLVADNSYVLAPYLVAENADGEETVIDPVANGNVSNYTFIFGQDKNA